MKVIILAAGYATRLYPLTLNQPKPLLPVAGKPMVEHVLDNLAPISGIDRVYVVTNDKFASHFEKWSAHYRATKSKLEFTVCNDLSTDDTNKLGAVGDIQFCIDQCGIDDDVVIIAGYNLFTYKLADAHAYFRRTGTDTLLGKRIDDLEELRRMGVVVLDPEGRVLDMVEKPQDPPSDVAIFATYFYKRSTLPLIREYLDAGNKPDAPGYFTSWLFRRREVRTYVFDGECYDIGTPKAYEQVQALFGR